MISRTLSNLTRNGFLSTFYLDMAAVQGRKFCYALFSLIMTRGNFKTSCLMLAVKEFLFIKDELDVHGSGIGSTGARISL